MKQLMTLPAVLMLVAMCSNPVTHHSVSKVDFAPIALGNTWVYACTSWVGPPFTFMSGMAVMTITSVDSLKDGIVFNVKVHDSSFSYLTYFDDTLRDTSTVESSYIDTLVKLYGIDSIRNFSDENPPNGEYEPYGAFFGLTTIPPKDSITTDTVIKYDNLLELIQPGYNYWDVTRTYLQNVGMIYYHSESCPINASVESEFTACLLTFNGKTPEQISKE